MAAFRIALEQGAEGIELDVHATADGIPVVIHDPTLDRTTDRSGTITELDVRAIEGADASAGWTPAAAEPPRWSQDEVRVPTFAQVVAWLPRDRGLAVDIKDVSAVRGIVRVLQEGRRAAELVLLMSFILEAIDEARRAAPSLPTALLLDIGDSLEAGIASAVTGSHAAIVPFDSDLGDDPARSVGLASAASLSLGCYVVNDPERGAQLRRAGVAFVISDVPAVVGGQRTYRRP